MLLQASRYEPFGLTVSEALAAGVPVVATSEVGASEGVSPEVCAVLAPGDVEGMAGAIEADARDASASDPGAVRRRARAEAERLFAETLVCERIERALLELAGRSGRR